MSRASLILRMRRIAGRHAGDGAPVALLAFALMIGGPAALAGIGKLADIVTPDMAARASDAPMSMNRKIVLPDTLSGPLPSAKILPDGLRARRALAVPVAAMAAPDSRDRVAEMPESATPVIAICVDDLGADPAGTAKAMALPENVTLAFLPYSQATPALAQEAEQGGHEVLAHVPMEPIGPMDPGPMTLKVGATDIPERLAWALARVPGLSGINNHEGSKFSTDTASLMPVAQALSERHLFFFDSRTIAGSRIVPVAHMFGVASAGRDVFLDNVVAESAIRARLEELASKARKSGVAIAIGHPHGATLRVLAAWLAEDHGVRLVPVSEAIKLKTEYRAIVAAK
jgi:polysaccharide deacetylase 2 family uncharacterized protein YibQ